MVDAQPVEFREHLAHAPPRERQRRSGVPDRVEHGVAPRLSLGIGPAGRRTHPPAGEEERAPAPDVLVGDADLQIAVEQQAQTARLPLEYAMLLVREPLPETVALDEPCMLRRQLGTPRLLRGFGAG